MTNLTDSKQAIRRWALDRRAQQPDKEALSRQIIDRLITLPEFAAARTVLIYLDVRSEVRTRHALPDLLKSGKQIIVPWCEQDALAIFRLESLEDLAPGAFGILEPQVTLRDDQARQVQVGTLDLVVAPGVAFDRWGGRLGHGMGYFDKLLARVRSDATLVGLAFECQMVERVPMESHDVRLHHILTEAAVYSP